MKSERIMLYASIQKSFTLFFACILVLSSRAAEIPFVFIPNQGQLLYSGGEKADDVLFYNNFNEMKVLFKKDRITYIIEEFNEERWRYFQSLVDSNKLAAQEFEKKDSAHFYRVDLVFENANPGSQLAAAGEQNLLFRYYLPQCPDGLEVNPTGEIVYKNLYPGIDVKFYGRYGGLKYDIIVHPGAKTEQMSFRYEGAEKISLEDGKLTIHNPVKSWTENIPVSYTLGDEKSELAEVAYAVKGNAVQFKLPNYDNEDTLVIDPAMTWSTHFNFSQNTIWDMDAHARNDRSIYMTRTGDQTIPNLLAGTGAYLQSSRNGTSADLVFLLFSTSGILHWATFYGGSSAEYLKGGIRFDSQGRIYAVVMSASSNMPLQTRAGAFNQSTKTNSFEAPVILRFNNNGVRDWGTFIQTGYYAANAGMDVGPNDNLFIGGYFGSSYKFESSVTLINPGGGAYYQSTKSVTPGSSFDDESFILEFSGSTGAMVWGTYFGSTGPERLYKVEVAPNGTIFMLGTASARQVTSGGTVFTPKVQAHAGGGYYDGTITTSNPEKLYIVKFNANRSFAWASLYGGTTGSNNPPGGKLNLCSDSQSNIYIVNGTRSNTFPTYNPGGGAYYDGVYNGDPSWDSNLFILKFANNSTRLWATFFSGTGWYTRPHCAVNSNNELYVVSGTTATDHPVLNLSGSYYKPTIDAYKDGMIGKFSSSGALQWSTYVGGVYSDEELNCVTVGSGACGNEIITYGRTGQGATAGSSSWPVVDPGGGAFVQGYTTNPGSSSNPSYYHVVITRFSEGGSGSASGTITWTGSVSNDWFNPCNWDKQAVPTASNPVVIPNGTTNKPNILDNTKGTAYCYTLSIASDPGLSSPGTLTIHTDAGGRLEVTQP